MKEKLVIISAPSGAGKTTLVRYLLNEISLLEFSISCTTRSPRQNEIHGKDYYFLSVEEFKKKINNHEFIEFEEVYSNQFYGTLKSEVHRIYNKNKIVIFDVDVEGGIAIKNKFQEQSLSIFIAPPNIITLEKRLLKRQTDSQKNIKTRIEKSIHEMSYTQKFDCVIINDDLQYTKKQLKEVINRFLNSHYKFS